MRYLLISEKPSLMRAVKDAFYKADMNFSVDFIPLHGHCCSLCGPEDYDIKYKKWSMEDLPIIPSNFKHKPVEIELVEKVRELINNNKYDGLINCTDAEREGQNIFYSLYKYLNLNLPVKRFWASDLTEPKLIEAWHNLRDDQNEPFLKNLTESSLDRAIMDWLVGMNFSRAVSLATNSNIPIGRVMTVVLSILSKRELEIKNFKPTKTYELMVDYKEGFSGKYKHDPFIKKEDCEALVKTVKPKLLVTKAENKIITNKAPLLFSLGDLQNEANKTFGYTLNETLAIAQSLYEAQITSYPRVDSQYLSTGEAKRMPTIVETCKIIPSLSDVKVIEEKVNNYVKSKYTDDSKIKGHYAIVLTGKKFEWDKLNQKQQNILTLIAKRILATCMEDAKTCEINITATSDDKEFITKENALIYAGYKTLYDEKVKNASLDKIKQGQTLNLQKAYVKEVISTCPARYNDASINKAMINVGNTIEDKELASALEGKTKDQGGIGTPATRAGIIEKLLDPKKNWVKRKGKNFEVTENGLRVYEIVKNYKVSSPILTAEWESKLKKIEDGEMESGELLDQVKDFVRDEVTKFAKEKSNTPAFTCPICGAPLKESPKYFYCSHYKESCNFIVPKDYYGAQISLNDLKNLLEGNSIGPRKFKSKEGKSYEAKLKLTEGKIERFFDKKDNDTSIICSCGQKVSKLSGPYGDYYKCKNCGKTANEKFLGHKLTTKELTSLFENKTVSMKKLTSKKGKTFGAKVVFKDGKLSIDSYIDNKE